MNENLLVSVIIPVYNVEKYMDNSIQSVVEQTYGNLEIILVNDGSNDNSAEICERWKKRDNRIKVIHKINGGLSSARNAALDICKGDFVYFLDSDDYIEKNTIEIMLFDAVKTGAQIVEAPFIHVYGKKHICRTNARELMILNTAEAIRFDLSAKGGSVSACSKLYIRDIFETYRFAEGKLNEDHLSIVELLSKGEIIAVEPKPLYYYVHRRNSITTSSFSLSSLDDLEAAYKNHDLISKYYPQVIDVAEFRIDFSTLKIIDKIMLLEKREENELLDRLIGTVKNNKQRIMRSKYFTVKRKLSILILLTNRTLYQKFVKGNGGKNSLYDQMSTYSQSKRQKCKQENSKGKKT